MRSRSIFAAAFLWIATTTLAADPPTWPDAKSLDKARERAADAFKQVPASPPTAPQAPARPAFGGLPTAPAGVDVEALARKYPDGSNPVLQPRPTRLLVFVSMSMPRASLQRLAQDAAKADATLVLRGFVHGSMKETVAAVRALLGDQTRTSWQIDPPAFARYGITSAPTTVLARHAKDDAADFVAVPGDVTLGYALDAIGRERPAFAPQAADFRKRLPAGD